MLRWVDSGARVRWGWWSTVFLEVRREVRTEAVQLFLERLDNHGRGEVRRGKARAVDVPGYGDGLGELLNPDQLDEVDVAVVFHLCLEDVAACVKVRRVHESVRQLLSSEDATGV